MILTRSDRFKVSDGRFYNVTPDGTHFHPDTPIALVEVLERCRRDNTKVRLFIGDRETGKTWDEERDVAGTIGRSIGPCKVPLIGHPQSIGGPHLLDHCVLAVLVGHGLYAWKAPNFDNGDWTVTTHPQFLGDRHVAASLRDGELIGRHRTMRCARRFVAFMSGHRMAA